MFNLANLSKKLKCLIRLTKLFFTPLAFIFLVYFSWQSREILTALFINANINWLFLSLIFWMLLHLLSPVFTQIIFRSLNIDIPYKTLFKIHSSRLPAKYLPGGIWHTVARANDYYKYGLNKDNLIYYLIVENIIIASLTLTLGGLIILDLIAENQPIWFSVISFIICCSFILLLSFPYLLKNILFRHQKALTKTDYFFALICVTFYWIIAATSFVLFIHAFGNIGLIISNIEIGGIYIFSWGIGFITLFAPQGIGVAEFVSSKLLTTAIGSETMIALLASFRLIVLIGDVLIWFISFLVNHEKSLD